MWVRGLKLVWSIYTIYARKVAPYVGAWIETFGGQVVARCFVVAPYVGAWIETCLSENMSRLL